MAKLQFVRETYGIDNKGVRYVAGPYAIRAWRTGSRVECWVATHDGTTVHTADRLAQAKAACQRHHDGQSPSS